MTRRTPSARTLRAVLVAAGAVGLVACGSSSGSPSGTVAAPASTTPAATTPAATTTPTVAAAGGQVPTSCSAIPVSLIGPYIGGVANTRQLGPTTGVSCEFANASATSILILNIGKGGTPAVFATLQAKTAGAGRTTASVPGLGVAAFSITNQGQPAGMEALDSSGVLYTVTARQAFGKDQTLIQQLMSMY